MKERRKESCWNFTTGTTRSKTLKQIHTRGPFSKNQRLYQTIKQTIIKVPKKKKKNHPKNPKNYQSRRD